MLILNDKIPIYNNDEITKGMKITIKVRADKLTKTEGLN